MEIREQKIDMLKLVRRINENVGRAGLAPINFPIFAARRFEHAHAGRPDGNDALCLVDLVRGLD